MRAVTNRRYGPPDGLRLEELPTPQPKADEVLLRVSTAAVTPPDCAARSGTPWFVRLWSGITRPRMTVLGGVCAGEVVAIGTDVTRFAVGDRVVGASAAFGAHAEYVCAPADGALAPIPPAVTDEEAVAVAEAGLTALPFLRDHGRVGPGQPVLVNGGSGSVGSAAVQLAKVMGAEVTAVCSTANVELVRSLGADRVIDYTEEDFSAATAAYRVIFDAVGKSSFGRCRRALTPGGVYLTTVPSMAILLRTAVLRFGSRRGAIAFTGLRRPKEQAKDLDELLELCATGRIRAVIDRCYPLERAADAHRYVDTERKRGTVLVTVDDRGA